MPPSIVTGKVGSSWENMKPILPTVIAVITALATALASTSAKTATMETQIKTIQEQGSKAFILEKEKYYQQFLQIQKDQSAMSQSISDMREDLREIKRELKDRR